MTLQPIVRDEINSPDLACNPQFKYTSLDVTAFSLQITQVTFKDKKYRCLKSKSEFGTLPFLKGSYLSLARDKIQCSKATHSVRPFVICPLPLFRHHYFTIIFTFQMMKMSVMKVGQSIHACLFWRVTKICSL